MAPMDEVLATCSSYIEQDHCVNEMNKCSNCSKMRNYLQVLTTELKSVQSIIKILMEENMGNRNNMAPSVESSNAQAPHHINVRNSLSDCVWTEVRGKKVRLIHKIIPQDVLSISNNIYRQSYL
jgi:hypothetical protein